MSNTWNKTDMKYVAGATTGFGANRISQPDASSGSDPLKETAEFFRTVREVLRINRTKLALRLDCDPQVIAALETARIDQLPDWSETERVICNYARELSIDPTPSLHILQTAIALRTGETALPRTGRDFATSSQDGDDPLSIMKSQGQTSSAEGNLPPGLARYRPTDRSASTLHRTDSRSIASAVTNSAKVTNRKIFDFFSRSGVGRFGDQPIRTLGILVVLIATYFWAASQGWFVQLAQSSFPGPVASMVRSTNDVILYYTSTNRDGLRWIEVEDPRTRRTDKLPLPKQSK